MNLHVLAQDLEIFIPARDKLKYKVNPIIRNVISLPAGGWDAIKFQLSLIRGKVFALS
ncbi:copper ion-binding laccase, putative [Medicago truncatula]|uniref:Copper ion-binding laccase, putative n=1 Tax=Medicago truncatula TaxID=3880 RepID=G7KLX8_MEDTR|nr:copper ion-binding laccase, putative [Medicago truncatula]